MPKNNGLEKLAQTNFYGEDGNFSLKNARAIYKWYLQNDYITGNLRKPTYDEFIEYIRSKMRLIPGAKTVKASLNQVLNEEAGGKYKGFLLQVNDEDIKDISPDKRAFNTLTLNPIEEAFLTEKYGQQRVKEYKAAVGRDKKAMGALNQFLAEKLGITFDMGHFQPSASSKGGVYGERGTSPEPSSFNRLQGAQPRSNQSAFAETGRSFSKIQDFYNWDLETKNLGVLGAKGLTPADFLAIERGVDPNQILLKRQQDIDSGLDIGDGKNYTENILRAYFGDEDFDRSWKHATESLSREKMRTGVNPATNKPVPAQERVETALLERPFERSRRTSIADQVGQLLNQSYADAANAGHKLVLKNGSLHFLKSQLPGPMDLVQSALSSNVGQKLGQGDIPGALKETGKNLVGGLVQQFTTPEGLATTAAMAGAAAVAPAAAGIGAGVLGTGAAIQGAINFEEGFTAGQRGVSVDQIRKEREDTWNNGLKNAAEFKSRIKRHLKKGLQITNQLPIPF